MYIVNKSRGGGKTTELIKMAAKEDATIICINKAIADYTKDCASKLGYSINTISWYEFCRFEPLMDKKYVIDNLDLILENVCRGKILAISITNTEFSNSNQKEQYISPFTGEIV